MIELDTTTYFSKEANAAFWSVSQFKEFNRCEAAGMAEAMGQYRREETDALLIGSYVDAYFSGSRALDEFCERHQDEMFTKKGDLYAKFKDANTMINAIECQPLMMNYLTGDKQVIQTAELFGVPWKIKMDVYMPDARIVDLKTVKDFGDVWDPEYGRRSWVEYWGYDIQGAIYQKVVEKNTGKKLPFFLAAVTKEKVPDVKVVEIPQHVLDAALAMVDAKIERFDLIKNGDVEPIRCESCDYCKRTKVLNAPEVYEIKEAE